MNLEKNKVGRFLAGKGFYMALALLLIGSVTATWFAFDQSLRPTQESSVAQAEPESKSAPIEKSSKLEISRGSSKDSSVSRGSESRAGSSSKPEQKPVAVTGSSEQLSVSYILPVDGEIINPYSAGELVKSATLGDWRTHDGVDIQADAATPVRAVASGMVKEVVSDPMFGTTVRIEHPNGVISVYQSLAENAVVQVGQSVEQGTVIGTVGETALAEVALPTHLHFAMTRDGLFIDPMAEMEQYDR